MDKQQYTFSAGIVLAFVACTGVVAGAGGYAFGSMKARLSYLEAAQSAPAVASLSAPVQTQQSVFQPDVQAPAVAPQQFTAAPNLQQSTAPLTAGLTPQGVPAQAEPVFNTPELAAQLLNAFSQTTGIRTDGPTETTGHPVYAFFDPRCPFCEKAVTELVGEVPVHWIPTTLLGDTENGVQVVEAMLQAEDKAQAMVEGHAGSLENISANAETRQAVNENAAVLYSVMGGAENSIAVPTILVPKPDGTIGFYRGFDVGDGASIIADFGG